MSSRSPLAEVESTELVPRADPRAEFVSIDRGRMGDSLLRRNPSSYQVFV